MGRVYCLMVDLKDDAELIAEYEAMHEQVWPEILRSIQDSGIESMSIYRLKNRMTMIMHVNDAFSFEAKAAADKANTKVQEWEELMWKYQQALPWAAPGDKWQLMESIFEFTAKSH